MFWIFSPLCVRQSCGLHLHHIGLRHYSLSHLIEVPRVRKHISKYGVFYRVGGSRSPPFSMSFEAWIAQFLGVASGWAGVTITTFLTFESPLFLQAVLSLGQSLGLSGKVSEHVVTYTRAWSVTPTCPRWLLGGTSFPGPSVCRGFESFLSLLLGVLD